MFAVEVMLESRGQNTHDVGMGVLFGALGFGFGFVYL
jgi:hypothetical protein